MDLNKAKATGTQAADSDQWAMWQVFTRILPTGQLMTDAERIEHRTQMRSLKTAKERTAFQLEHHKRMQERAREKGLTLPDTPPASGKGLGAGTTGGGMGAGPAGGMGAGQSRKQ